MVPARLTQFGSGVKQAAVLGEFAATGVVPRLVDELRDRDVQIPISLFQKPRGAADV